MGEWHGPYRLLYGSVLSCHAIIGPVYSLGRHGRSPNLHVINGPPLQWMATGGAVLMSIATHGLLQVVCFATDCLLLVIIIIYRNHVQTVFTKISRIDRGFHYKHIIFLNGHSFSWLLIVVHRTSLQVFHRASQIGGIDYCKGAI